MIALGLIISLASVPGYTSATIPAGWAAMSIVLPMTLWREAKWSTLHTLLVLFLACAVISFLQTPVPLDGVFRLWQLLLIYLAFRLGSTMTDLRPIVLGLAWGGVVSSAISVGQWFGIDPVLRYTASSSGGLFFNHVIQGQTLGVLAVACFVYRLWLPMLLLLHGIYLSDSRGGWLVLALGIALTFFPKPKLLVAAIALGLAAVYWTTGLHEIERQLIWEASLHSLSTAGNGIGSFYNLWIVRDLATIVHPEHAHNDILQLLYEFGIGAVPLLAAGVAIVLKPSADEWPIVAAIIFLSFFAFPIFVPISAFLLALCAGRISRDGDCVWDRLPDSRYGILLRSTIWRCVEVLPGRKTIPVPYGTTKAGD